MTSMTTHCIPTSATLGAGASDIALLPLLLFVFNSSLCSTFNVEENSHVLDHLFLPTATTISARRATTAITRGGSPPSLSQCASAAGVLPFGEHLQPPRVTVAQPPRTAALVAS
jgi:hypothetical protein